MTPEAKYRSDPHMRSFLLRAEPAARRRMVHDASSFHFNSLPTAAAV